MAHSWGQVSLRWGPVVMAHAGTNGAQRSLRPPGKSQNYHVPKPPNSFSTEPESQGLGTWAAPPTAPGSSS